MKVIIYILSYIALTVLYFLILSGIGLLWLPYKEVISNPGWFVIYIMFFHWWMVIPSLFEYYEINVKPVFRD
jgi:hypothetical protein